MCQISVDFDGFLFLATDLCQSSQRVNNNNNIKIENSVWITLAWLVHSNVVENENVELPCSVILMHQNMIIESISSSNIYTAAHM